MQKQVLVTGGLGYIGSHTIVELVQAGFAVVVVDNLSNSSSLVLDRIKRITGKDVDFYELDCANENHLRAVFERNNFFGVIHFAALKSVEESMVYPEKYRMNNVFSTEVLQKLCVEFAVEKLVFSSSCTVYGTPDVNPVDESCTLQPPASVYGETKQSCERLLLASSGIKNLVILRYFNPIGAHPTGFLGEDSRVAPTNLVPILCEVALGKRETFHVFGTDYNTPDGTCIRDYIHVCDLARAHVQSLLFEQTNAVEIFNLGVGRGFSVKEILDAFQKVIGRTISITYGPRRIGDIPAIWAVSERARVLLNWTCLFGAEQALEHAWQWVSKKNLES
ncbi:MAG: UDP-glucose 4-epimerase GalE [Bacteroidota bacterium]|jgi:UDP-glucose 4-epimerase